MNEEWRVIEDFPDYEISNHGRIWSNRTNKVLRPAIDRNGYYSAKLWSGKKAHFLSLHRLVATYFIGPGGSLDINHIDGNKNNNHVDNLEWVTRSQNLKHAHFTGLKRPSGGHKIRPIRVIETGMIFDNTVECAKYFDMHSTNIQQCLKLGRPTRDGFSFEYADE